MSPQTAARTEQQIMAELCTVTRQMLQHKQNADILTKGIETREALRQEFDLLLAAQPSLQQAAIRAGLRRQAKDILAMDAQLLPALEALRREAKDRLAGNHSKQKVMSYMTGALSSTGSYMDYRK